jgi:hypothetical protein
MPGAATHGRHELIVQLDHLIQEGLFRFDEEAGQKGLAFGWGKAFERLDIIPFC